VLERTRVLSLDRSSARKKKGSGDGQAGLPSAWMIAPMVYMIQIDCDNNVIVTEGEQDECH
jgi:hypothetical protein